MYYTCSHKKAGCLGRAQVSVTEQSSETGKPFKEYLSACCCLHSRGGGEMMLVSCRQERPWAMILVRMVTPVELWLTENIQYHFQSPVLPHLEPVIKPGSIFAMKTKDNGWTRAQVLYQQREIKPAAGRSRRACRSWEWGPPPTACLLFLQVDSSSWRME